MRPQKTVARFLPPNFESVKKMLTVIITMTMTLFVRCAITRLWIVTMVTVSVMAFVEPRTTNAEEGFIRGSLKAVIHELDGKRKQNN